MRGGIRSVLAAHEPASRKSAHVLRSVAIPIMLVLMVLPAETRVEQVEVIVESFQYVPNKVSILRGDTVTWINQQGTHSATSNAPLSLWDSGLMSRESYSFQFEASGRYLYHCTLHFDMTGLVSVVPTASPESGQVGTVFTITVASADASSRFVYDVQRKVPGGGFQDWIAGATTASVEFDSTGQSPGRYQFRARLRKTPDNVSSLWSPPVSIRVDPAG
jgi:plastocyanin